MNHWVSDKDIEVVDIDGKWYALSGWNGEVYTDCWETEPPTFGTSCDILHDGIRIKPIYAPYPDDPEQFDVIAYQVLS